MYISDNNRFFPPKSKANHSEHMKTTAILFQLFRFLLASLFVMSFSRIVLILWQADRVEATGKHLVIILTGMRFDLMLCGFLMVIPIFVLPLVGAIRLLQPLASKIFTWWMCLSFAFIVLMELTTAGFIGEYDARPNILFVEYIKYPREVIPMLWGGFKLALIAVCILFPLLAWSFSRYMLSSNSWTQPLGLVSAIVLSLTGSFLCALAARSTFDHRPVNPSIAAITSDSLVNDLGLNSGYSLLYAMYENVRDGDGAHQYGEGDLQKLLQHNNIATTVGGPAVSHHIQIATVPREKPLNLVFIVEESLGAEFVGSLGGLPLTPNIDSLQDQGIWFKRLYATGTRSVRGLEAIVSGFPPTTARSTVKLQKTQRNFFTIASLLKTKGYETSFLYGGAAHFDNMARFFSNNGVNSILDKHDFPQANFVGSWGISDEDLFSNAHQHFSKQTDKPFFSLVFTTTNHTPFEYPDGRIQPYDSEKQTVNNAVKYADYALGEYLAKARKSDYWDSTVFVVISDHNSRVYGDALLPVKRFHIPGVILGGSIKPMKIDKVASQIDILPTVLSLIGVNSVHPAIGRDLTLAKNRQRTGRAIMQFHATQGYMEGDQLIVLRRNMDPVQFQYTREELSAVNEVDPVLLSNAYAYSDFPIQMIKTGNYRLSDQTVLDTTR